MLKKFKEEWKKFRENDEYEIEGTITFSLEQLILLLIVVGLLIWTFLR